jgi:hypothetical protein
MSAYPNSVAPPNPASLQEIREQVDRIVRSKEFRGSETLRALLSFLATCALEGRAEPVGVREIARAVFGRSEDFDSQNDSVVRVHTGRLRSKLAEYYMEEGADDDVIIAIPKGSYSLFCHRRQVNVPAALADSPAISIQPEKASQPVLLELEARRSISIGLALCLLGVAIAATWFAGSWLRQRSSPVPETIREFWSGFAMGDESPLLVFSNFKFIELAGGSLETVRGPDSAGRPVIDTYTTMGEVMGVFEVSKALARFDKSPRVKRSRLLTWDEAKDSSLIFIGGPLAETPLRDVQLLKDFKFLERTPSTSGAIANLHPQSGEQPVYSVPIPYPAVHAAQSVTDYALVVLRPGLTANHRILILAGITEYGTQGATEYVTSKEHLEELLSKLHVKRSQPLPWFEALLRVRLEGGVPLDSSIEALHLLH